MPMSSDMKPDTPTVIVAKIIPTLLVNAELLKVKIIIINKDKYAS